MSISTSLLLEARPPSLLNDCALHGQIRQNVQVMHSWVNRPASHEAKHTYMPGARRKGFIRECCQLFKLRHCRCDLLLVKRNGENTILLLSFGRIDTRSALLFSTVCYCSLTMENVCADQGPPRTNSVAYKRK
jgi:hypothetical protein